MTYFQKWNNHSASTHVIEILIQALEFHICAATLPPSPKFLQKELILNQRYLPHPGSDSTECFFEIGYFFTKNPDLQLDFADLAPGRPDLCRKLTALKNYLQPH